MTTTCNKQIKSQLSLLGPPLRRLFCAFIAQNSQLRYGPLFGRYVHILHRCKNSKYGEKWK